MERIVILGAGFAGLWAAVGAARALDERGISPDRVEVTVVNATPWHSIRVRNYESDLSATRVPLADILDPIGVRLVVAEIVGLSLADRTVSCVADGTSFQLAYDRMVFALGSRLVRPPIPGVREHTFDVDTYAAAMHLGSHLSGLAREPGSAGRDTVLVVGAGLTGIEVATEMPGRLRAALAADPQARPRVILADRAEKIGSDMGEGATAVIAEALAALHVETRPGIAVAAVDPGGATLTTGERVDSRTVVWCAGMEASPLTAGFPVTRDRFGPPAGAAQLEDRGSGRGICCRGRGMANDRWHSFLCHVVPAWSANGTLRRPQCGLRLARRAHAAADNRLVYHHSGPRRLGCGLHRGMGPPGGRAAGGCQTHEGDNQPPAHLSAAITRPEGDPRCRGADPADTPCPWLTRGRNYSITDIWLLNMQCKNQANCVESST